jgi:hypothetical protein
VRLDRGPLSICKLVTPHRQLLHEPSDAELSTPKAKTAQDECLHSLVLVTFPFCLILSLVGKLTRQPRLPQVRHSCYALVLHFDQIVCQGAALSQASHPEAPE